MNTLHPLGRKVNHDPRSLAYPFLATTATLVNVTHTRMVPIFDQGSLGSCTGNAAVGAVGTAPLYDEVPLALHSRLNEAEAVKIYSAATTLDTSPGSYPPTDTGSDGVSAASACKTAGLISGYTHCFSLAAVQTALQSTPVIIGINWYSGFDNPDAKGFVKVSGSVRGGHEVCLVGIDVVAKTVTAANSWGEGWGAAGYFTFSWADLERLLNEQGDATVLLPLTAPAPTPVPVPPFPTPTPVPPADADAVLAVTLHKWLNSSPRFYHPVQAAASTWLTSKNL
jgi:hypothetical protein